MTVSLEKGKLRYKRGQEHLIILTLALLPIFFATILIYIQDSIKAVNFIVFVIPIIIAFALAFFGVLLRITTGVMELQFTKGSLNYKIDSKVGTLSIGDVGKIKVKARAFRGLRFIILLKGNDGPKVINMRFYADSAKDIEKISDFLISGIKANGYALKEDRSKIATHPVIYTIVSHPSDK